MFFIIFPLLFRKLFENLFLKTFYEAVSFSQPAGRRLPPGCTSTVTTHWILFHQDSSTTTPQHWSSSPWTALPEGTEDYIGTVQPNQLEKQMSKCQCKNTFNYQKGDISKTEPSTSTTASHEHSTLLKHKKITLKITF